MRATLVTFEERFGARTLRVHAAKHPSSVGDRTPPGGRRPSVEPAAAFVSAGRWVAICPDPGCGGAEYVSFDRPWFFCCECRNVSVGHRQRPVVVPAERQRVEELLSARPDPRTRHWNPREPVDLLAAENREHGVEA